MLAGKAALVTGGATGIGRATALAMAREGARLAVADLAPPEETVAAINAAGGQAIAMAADMRAEADIAAMVARTVAAFGRIDVAFNNAGVAPRAVGPVGQRTHEMSRESFEAMLDVNLTGVFLCMKHEIAAMLGSGGGAIVNTASIAGLLGLPTASNYVASKHGVVGITRTAALEYATDGIRVNAVCPGYVRTPMTDATMQARGEYLMGLVPQRRLGEPEEIAEAVVWLCSDRASFVTGSAYTLDGGYSAA